MLTKSLSIQVNNETLACSIHSSKDLSIPPRLIFLHSAGSGCKERIESLAPTIADQNINILTLDFSGHGSSTGELKASSLNKRVNEAKTSIDQYAAAKTPLIICGMSMGGFIAIKLLELYQIDTLILFCPALYSKDAYSVRFDQGFTEIIREHESWRNTDVLYLLEKFTGKLLVVMGDKDEVIPAGVIELIISHTPNAQKKELYIIPNCPHKITNWLVNNEVEKMKLEQKILEYTISNC